MTVRVDMNMLYLVIPYEKKNIQQYLLNDDFYGMLEWYTEKESVNKDLQDYWKWALHAFNIPDDFFK